MEPWSVPNYVYAAAILLITGIALYTDLRIGKIKNWLTIPAFFLGWFYQYWVFGQAGLLNGLQGFALGFGTYFVLMLIGGGGGGDLKLMGALSVWMGFRLTLYVMIVSTVVVALDLLFAMFRTMIRSGIRGMMRQHFPQSNSDAEGDPGRRPKPKPRTMRFAIASAVGCWVILIADATVLKGYHLPP
jgi:prepilin peptidase CpaA